MSYKQVKYFQDLEDYSAAYKIARADWEANPSLKWPKNTIAWLLIRMMKFNARAYAKNKFLQQLEEFKTLGIPKDDKKLLGPGTGTCLTGFRCSFYLLKLKGIAHCILFIAKVFAGTPRSLWPKIN